MDVRENGRAQAEFLGLDAPYGFSRGEVRIDSADTLPADDHFIFAVERTDPRKVLFVDDGRRPRAELYYQGRARCLARCRVSARILASGASREREAVELRRGCAVRSWRRCRRDLKIRSSAMSLAAERCWSRWGPVRPRCREFRFSTKPIQASSYAGREGERFLSVSEIDAGHPALRSVESLRRRQVLSGDPRHAVEIDGAGEARTMARRWCSNGRSAKAKCWSSPRPSTTAPNDLPLHAAWVPFVQQSAAYLGGGGAEQPVNLTVDSYVELRAADSKGAAAEVLDPDGKRLLSLEEAASAKNFAVRREGFFELKTASGRSQPDCGPRGPPRIGPVGDAAGNAGSVEGHRAVTNPNTGASSTGDQRDQETGGPLAMALIAIVRSSGGRIGGGGPVPSPSRRGG